MVIPGEAGHVDTHVAVADDGTRLAVRVMRRDITLPAFVLVHGLASNARLWDGVADELAALDHSVFAVDLRGHGQSEKPATGYDFATMSADLAAVVRDVVGRRAILVGQSWGGNVVLETANRYPEVTRAVACIDGGFIRLADSFGSWPEAEEALRPPRRPGMTIGELEQRFGELFSGFPESGIRGQIANFAHFDDGTVQPHLDLEHHMSIVRYLWQHDPDEVATGLDVPVWLMPVDDGRPGKRERVESFTSKVKTSRTFWTTGHHDIHAEQPRKVVEMLLDLAAAVAR